MKSHMQEEKGKKISILYILQILKEYSDEHHALSQQQIIDLLQKHYGQSINRKSVKRDLERLKDAGFPIASKEISREIQGKNNALTRDWQWLPLFSEDEILLLIDTLYFSHMNLGIIKKLSDKLRKLRNHLSEDSRTYIRNVPFSEPIVKKADMQQTLIILSEALKAKSKIKFQYMYYKADLKRYPHLDKDGNIKEYSVSPYIIYASDQRYFLLCNVDGDRGIKVFNLSLIEKISMIEGEIIPLKSLPEAEHFRSVKYIKPMLPIYTEGAVTCKFRADNSLITNILEQFGKAATIISASQNEVEVEVLAPTSCVEVWAFSYAPLVRVTGPEELVKKIRDKVASLQRMYER
ncbi:MAG: helix-turn-helix transcriptional regulator [Dialister pneumosintes]